MRGWMSDRIPVEMWLNHRAYHWRMVEGVFLKVQLSRVYSQRGVSEIFRFESDVGLWGYSDESFFS